MVGGCCRRGPEKGGVSALAPVSLARQPGSTKLFAGREPEPRRLVDALGDVAVPPGGDVPQVLLRLQERRDGEPRLPRRLLLFPPLNVGLPHLKVEKKKRARREAVVSNNNLNQIMDSCVHFAIVSAREGRRRHDAAREAAQTYSVESHHDGEDRRAPDHGAAGPTHRRRSFVFDLLEKWKEMQRGRVRRGSHGIGKKDNSRFFIMNALWGNRPPAACPGPPPS